jgi:hypothetical protein
MGRPDSMELVSPKVDVREPRLDVETLRVNGTARILKKTA